MGAAAVDEHQVADVDDESPALRNGEHGVPNVNCVDEGDDPAAEREVPEHDRDVADLLPLGGDPLDDEARAEDQLAGKAEGDPEVPVPGFHGCPVSRSPGLPVGIAVSRAGRPGDWATGKPLS